MYNKNIYEEDALKTVGSTFEALTIDEMQETDAAGTPLISLVTKYVSKATLSALSASAATLVTDHFFK